MTILRPLEWGFPLTVSRNTDIPAFHMDRWFEWMDRGWLHAAHPQTGVPEKWSLKPEDVHSIMWWSKDFGPFLKHPRRKELDVYRNTFAFTIRGHSATEPNVPDLNKQLDAMEELVKIYGPEVIQWRYSPIPPECEFSFFSFLCEMMAEYGIKECHMSFLHPEGPMPDTRGHEEQLIHARWLAKAAREHGIALFVCWDDEWLVKEIDIVHAARCINAERMDRIFGLEQYEIKHPRLTQCGCSVSIEVANQKLLPCHHRCPYCYAVEGEN